MDEGKEEENDNENEEEETIQEEPKVDENKVQIGTHVYLVKEQLYAFVKSEIDENMYECVVKTSKSESDTRMLMLFNLNE